MLTTNTLLLEGLHDEDNLDVWREFDHRYRPVLAGFARRLGLGEDDAADAAQETLIAFAEAHRRGQYQRARGRLRSWLFALARQRVADAFRQARRGGNARGDSELVEVQDPARLSETWEDEWRRAVLRAGLAELRATSHAHENSLRAFEMIAFEDRTPADVAAELGMSLTAVYTAKSRLLDRLREILSRLREEF